MEQHRFDEWMSHFTDSISGYDYYVDFEKVVENASSIKIELNILNSLVGSKDIENEFRRIISQYPRTMKCIPILLAVRGNEIKAMDENGKFSYAFNSMNQSVDQYLYLMKKTGLFDLIQNRIVSNLYDYVLGVEVGLDSNGRKNRGGHQMENLVERHLGELGLSYFKEMNISEIEARWGMDLSAISNNGSSTKRFDFVVEKDGEVYAIEVNFYTSGGSKLNETARSYKMIAEEAEDIPHFHFVWITDGLGWKSAKSNLKETVDVLDTVYSIHDLESGSFESMIDRHENSQ